LDGTTLVGRGTISSKSSTSNNCWNPLQRSLAIGSELVTVGMTDMAFSDRATLETRASASWGAIDQYGCYTYVN
jgi:hypothetical protein